DLDPPNPSAVGVSCPPRKVWTLWQALSQMPLLVQEADTPKALIHLYLPVLETGTLLTGFAALIPVGAYFLGRRYCQRCLHINSPTCTFFGFVDFGAGAGRGRRGGAGRAVAACGPCGASAGGCAAPRAGPDTGVAAAAALVRGGGVLWRGAGGAAGPRS